MKGKISFYYDAPNTGKIRARINPTPEFTAKMRSAIQEVAVEVLNEQTYAMRTKLIKRFSEMGEVVKDDKYIAQLNSAMSAFFDVHCQLTPFSKEEKEETPEEPVDENPEEPVDENPEEPVDENPEEPKKGKAAKAPKAKKEDPEDL